MKAGIKILGVRVDLKAMSLCVLTASVFWFFSALNQDYTVDILYPIEIKYDDTKVVPVKPLPKRIKINVTGYGWSIFRNYLGIETDPVIYEAKNLPKRKFVSSRELSPIVHKTVSEIQFNHLVSDTLAFDFEYIKQKQVKVVIDSANISLAELYQITSPVIASPDFVVFKGAGSVLEKIPDTIKLVIPKTDIKENYEGKVKVPHRRYPKVEMLNKHVTVRFVVEKFQKSNLVVKPQQLHFPQGKKEFYYDGEIILTYFVKEEYKNTIDPEKFSVLLDYRKIDRYDSTITPQLVKKPRLVYNYYFTPYAVKIKYRK